MKKIIFICLLIVFFSSTLFSQNDKIITEKSTTTSSKISFAKELPKEGTYQIIYTATESVPTIADEILFTVNERRKAEEMEYIIVDEQTKIKILPYSIIYAKDFVPVDTYIIE